MRSFFERSSSMRGANASGMQNSFSSWCSSPSAAVTDALVGTYVRQMSAAILRSETLEWGESVQCAARCVDSAVLGHRRGCGVGQTVRLGTVQPGRRALQAISPRRGARVRRRCTYVRSSAAVWAGVVPQDSFCCPRLCITSHVFMGLEGIGYREVPRPASSNKRILYARMPQLAHRYRCHFVRACKDAVTLQRIVDVLNAAVAAEHLAGQTGAKEKGRPRRHGGIED